MVSIRKQLAVTAGLSGVCALVGNHLGQALDGLALNDALTTEGALQDALAKGAEHLAQHPLDLSPNSYGWMGSMLGFCVPLVAWLMVQQQMNKGNRLGEEHGSAKWAQQRELEKFASAGNPNPYNRLILSQHYGLAISRDGFDQQHDRNLNVCVIGGSGSGKTRYFVKPNLLQQSFNYFVTDPKYTLPRETLHLFIDQGWEFAIFNTNQVDQSMIYNPFAYLHTDLEISEFVDAFLAMTKDQSKSGGDQFWDDSTNLLLCSLIAYCRDWVPPEENHFGTLLNLLDMAQVKEGNEDFKSELDLLFDEIETGYYTAPADAGRPKGGLTPARTPDPASREVKGASTRRYTGGPQRRLSNKINNTTGLVPGERRIRDGRVTYGLTAEEDYSLSLYKKFKTAAGKTLKSILISVNVKLKAIATKEVLGLLAGEDEMHLEKLADPDCKYIIFDSFKDVNTQTLGFIHGLLVWQTMQVCINKADSGKGKLARPMQFILDEFKSLNLPKSIADMISVVRSRNVGMCIILQSMEQLYQMYDEHCANGIVGCCDTTLYLGGGDNATNKQMSDTVGQQTVHQVTTSASHQGIAGGSWSQNSNTVARALIDQAEVGKLARDECLVLIKGTDSAKDKKFDVEHHPYYKYIDPPDIAYHKPVKFRRLPLGEEWSPDGTMSRGLRKPFETVAPAHDEAVDLTEFFADLKDKREERRRELERMTKSGEREHPFLKAYQERERRRIEKNSRATTRAALAARARARGGGRRGADEA